MDPRPRGEPNEDRLPSRRGYQKTHSTQKVNRVIGYLQIIDIICWVTVSVHCIRIVLKITAGIHVGMVLQQTTARTRMFDMQDCMHASQDLLKHAHAPHRLRLFL